METFKASDFVPMLRALWNEQKNRELLYLEALKKEGMAPFRRLLSQGHVSAVLFQKEIRAIYDYFKCFLNDKDLGDANQIALKASLQSMEHAQGKEEVATCLKKIESATIQGYRSLRTHFELENEFGPVLEEHLSRISEFYDTLTMLELGTRQKAASSSYTAAA